MGRRRCKWRCPFTRRQVGISKIRKIAILPFGACGSPSGIIGRESVSAHQSGAQTHTFFAATRVGRPSESMQPLWHIPKKVARNLRWAYNDYRIYHAPPDRSIRKSGTLFIHVPKCAGTSIAAAIYGKKLPHITLQEYALKMTREELRSLNTISVVRDPLDRIRSLYKFVQRSYPNARHDTRHAYHHFHVAGCLNGFLESLERSYVDCIRLLWPQLRFLQLGSGVPSWITLYRFTDLGELQKDLGKPLEILNRAPDIPEEPLSEQAVGKVMELYAQDYEAFGFSRQRQRGV